MMNSPKELAMRRFPKDSNPVYHTRSGAANQRKSGVSTQSRKDAKTQRRSEFPCPHSPIAVGCKRQFLSRSAMIQVIDATFEDGVLKPTLPLSLPPHTPVRLTVEY